MSINRPDSEWKLLLDAIRVVHEDVPVFIFGGHNHVRNCERLDGNSISCVGVRRSYSGKFDTPPLIMLLVVDRTGLREGDTWRRSAGFRESGSDRVLVNIEADKIDRPPVAPT